MGIREMIQRKKDQFFVARDSEKRALQIESLKKQAEITEKERRETQEIRRLQAQISGGEQQIHDARTAGSRGIAQKIGAGFKSFGAGAKKFEKGVSQFGGQPNKNSPFYTGGAMGSSPKSKKSGSKNIHIHIGK